MAGEREARTAQTKARIKEALVGLIAEKGFDALTVSDVTRRAGINRGTFYLHFIDKYDMLDKLEGELIARLEDTLLANPPAHATVATELFPYETILRAVTLANEDFAFVRAISGRGGDPNFAIKLKGSSRASWTWGSRAPVPSCATTPTFRSPTPASSPLPTCFPSSTFGSSAAGPRRPSRSLESSTSRKASPPPAFSAKRRAAGTR